MNKTLKVLQANQDRASKLWLKLALEEDSDLHSRINVQRSDKHLAGVVSRWSRIICPWSAILIDESGTQAVLEKSQSHDLQTTLNALFCALEKPHTPHLTIV